MLENYFDVVSRGRIVHTELKGLYRTFELNGTRATIRVRNRIIPSDKGILAEAKYRVRRVLLMRLHNGDTVDEIVQSTFYGFAKTFSIAEANKLLGEYSLQPIEEGTDLSQAEALSVLRSKKHACERKNRHASEVVIAWIDRLRACDATGNTIQLHNNTDRKAMRIARRLGIIEVHSEKKGRGGFVKYKLGAETDRIDLFVEQVEFLLPDHGYHSRRKKSGISMSEQMFEVMLQMIRSLVDKQTPLPIHAQHVKSSTTIETGVVPESLRVELAAKINQRATALLFGSAFTPAALELGISQSDTIPKLDRNILDYFSTETQAIKCVDGQYRYTGLDDLLAVKRSMQHHVAKIGGRLQST